MIEVTHVKFRQIFPSEQFIVPLAEAWQFWLDTHKASKSLDTHFMATVRDTETGRTWDCFAKAWLIWDETMRCEQLVRIGLGASGDGGPHNPDPRTQQMPKFRLSTAGWYRALV